MTDTDDTKMHITIVRKHTSTFARWLNVIFLVGVVIAIPGLSRVWFGGSWVIDVFTLFLAGVVILGIGKRFADREDKKTMTREELRQWLDAQ